MCGRFALDQEMDDLISAFAAQHNRFPQWLPRWNIAPGATIPIVLERTRGVREIGPARWSLVPSWSKEITTKYPTFNARSETAAHKPTFRNSLSHHRCVIPATGFYEWAQRAGTRTPHWIERRDNAVINFAGLFSWWEDPQTRISHATTTILTRDSSGPLVDLHDRMPVFVTSEEIEPWLNPENQEGEELLMEISESTKKRSADVHYYPVAPLQGAGPHLALEDFVTPT